MKKLLINTGLWIVYFIGAQIGMAFLSIGIAAEQLSTIPQDILSRVITICGVLGIAYLTGFSYLYWKKIYVKFQPAVQLPKPWMFNPFFPLALYLVFLVVEFFLPVEPTANQISVEAFIVNQPFFAFCTVVIFAPLMEELLFRGIFGNFFADLGKTSSLVFYLLLNSSLFSMAHGPSILPQFLIYFTMGICLTWIYLAKRDIRYSMGLHAFNNLLSFVLISLF